VTGVPLAHIGGIPIEETLGALGPALLVALGVAWAKLRARLSGIRFTLKPSSAGDQQS
jgi:hypothetical protein